MEKLYFLIAIGVIAVLLVSWLVRSEQKRSHTEKRQKTKAQQLAQLHHRHVSAPVRHGTPGQSHLFHPRPAGAFDARNQRAGEEFRDGSALTAERIYSDEESPEAGLSQGLAMPAIKYVPEDTPRVSQPRR